MFTKTELDLCRKIAEKERKEIRFGSWVLYNEQEYLVIDYFRHKTEPTHLNLYGLKRYVFETDVTPLLSSHDCLEWLKKRYGEIFLKTWLGTMWCVSIGKRLNEELPIIGLSDLVGKTPLEALLRAVLAILEEEHD